MKYGPRILQYKRAVVVKFHFYVRGEELRITIANNTVLSRQEEASINDKIEKACDFESMSEAMHHI